MGFTGQPGRPDTAEGWLKAETYGADPDNTPLPNWLSQEIDNTAKAYFLSMIRDIFDIVTPLSETSPAIHITPQYVDEDVTIPPNFDGYSHARGISDGVTVSVSEGSILRWLTGDIQLEDKVQVTTNMTIEDFSGNYEMITADASKVKRNTGAAATFTIPTVADASWQVGDTVTIINEGSGDVTITPALGVTIVGSTTVATGGNPATAVMTSNDNWVTAGAS